MKFLTILGMFYSFTIILAFYIYFAGLDNYYPDTMALITSSVSSSSGEANNLVSNGYVANPGILDIVGSIVGVMFSTFNVIKNTPFIVATFIRETLQMLDLPYNPVIASVIQVSYIISIIYLIKVVMEWIRPGSTQNT